MSFKRFIILLLSSVAIVLAAYWPGLSGPFLLDDHATLAPVQRWLAGQQGWQGALLPNQGAFILSRPVSMASFMLNAWLAGGDPFFYKLGNLITHLLCAALGGWLLHRIFRMDARLAPHADMLAAIATIFWLLHPLHASTVLYAVQRMAQLATLFTLAAVLAFFFGRQQLRADRLRPAALNLFLLFPLLTLLGVLSKQNAAIAPFVCLVLEIAYFNDRSKHRKVLQGFFSLFVALPILAATALLMLSPGRLLAGYADWDFTVWDRLLTQPRVLMEYIGMWFVPRGPQMGLYTDAYPASTGFLSPPSTLLSILAIVAMSGMAIVLRKRAPSIFAGWFFFLVAHAVESTFLPLEMYYEHRNYLPSFGLLLMTFGFGALLPENIKAGSLAPRRLGLPIAGALTLALAFATFSRAIVWHDERTIVAQGIEQHPESLRVRMDWVSIALREQDYASAATAFAPMIGSPDPRQRMVSRLITMTVNCVRGAHVDAASFQRAAANAPLTITIHEVFVAQLLAQVGQKDACASLTARDMANGLASMLDDASQQPESALPKSTVRLNAAVLYSLAGDWQEAELHAAAGWSGVRTMPLGQMLARSYIENGDLTSAASIIDDLRHMTNPRDLIGNAQIAHIEQSLDAKLMEAPTPSLKAR